MLNNYKRLNPYLTPFSCFSNPPNYRSSFCTTDHLGFRGTAFHDKIIYPSSFKKNKSYGVLLGGSTAFGWGATSDSRTISSLLSKSLNEPFLNLGVMAASSMQEFINILPYLPFIKTVVILSGLNDIHYSATTKNIFPYPILPFFEDLFQELRLEDALFIRSLISKKINPYNFLSTNSEKLKFLIKKFKFSSQRLFTKKNNCKNNEWFKSSCLQDACALSFKFANLIEKIAEKNTKIIYCQQPIQILNSASHNPKMSKLIQFIAANYLNYSQMLKKTFKKNKKIKFINLNKFCKGKELFLDFCHLNDEGNHKISCILKAYI